MNRVAGTGNFVSWNGGCLFVGRDVGVIPMHAHYAIQIAFGSEHGLRFRSDDRADWLAYHGAIIASRQPHSMDATGLRYNAVMFVEPETREGRALAEKYVREGIVGIPGDVLAGVAPAVFSAWLDERSTRALRDACWRVIRALTGGVEPSIVTDERIVRAIAFINANLSKSLSLENVAAEAFLSPSRFRHLFVEQTGMALRPYILWRRFLRVWELLSEGATLSSAAHAAGFADSAHLTRTSRRMFGIPPSAMHVGRALSEEGEHPA